MTRPAEQVEQAKVMLAQGVSQAETARRLGIPRSTVVTWSRTAYERKDRTVELCEPCRRIAEQSGKGAYAYLLGLYLGDGCISANPKGGFRLRVTLDKRYPGIIDECQAALASVLPQRVGIVGREGCVEVWSYSKHWPCLFPQHGPGRKHERRIILEPWQEAIALGGFPELLLRGLIHSDGCRVINTVKQRYHYTRYHFTNSSPDIHEIFRRACERIGVTSRFNNRVTQSVARRPDVARLDEFIGPKY